MKNDSLKKLTEIAATYPPAEFRPMAFFAARCGVLTVVFDGFSESVLQMKRDIERELPHLEGEHEGSRWPKVTLAVLKDGERLRLRDIVRLRDLADDWNEVLHRQGQLLWFDRLTAVEFGCRSTERRFQSVELPLSAESSEKKPSPTSVEFVATVVDQFSRERMDEYARELEKDGHRESHYRNPVRGWSLIADLPAGSLPLAERLLDEVEKSVPGKYCRFHVDSRHITIRSLDPA